MGYTSCIADAGHVTVNESCPSSARRRRMIDTKLSQASLHARPSELACAVGRGATGPFKPCDIGYYKVLKGAGQCEPCPECMETVRRGARLAAAAALRQLRDADRPPPSARTARTRRSPPLQSACASA